jgi:hypothetical protein
MLIAQLFVAGEGDLYPLDLPSETTEADQTVLDDFLAGQSNLPWVVFRAAHRAANFPDLPARARAVLAALARTVDANNPYAAIFARRELLTGRSMQSMRTFYRSLDDLEEAGLIERAPQKRYGAAGLFGRAYLHLTERSAIVLGYLARPSDTKEASIALTNPPAGSTESSTFMTPCATVADGAIYKDLYPKNQKRQPASVPGDLERLLGLGFHRFLIFKLMREAKAHAKLLSDVVEATWEHLRNAKHPINYLRTLLRTPVDFGHQVRTKFAAVEEKHAAIEREKQIASTVTEFAGKTFIDSTNTRLITVSASGESIAMQHFAEPAPRIAVAKWQEEFVAAVKARKICLVTEARASAFKAKCGERSTSSDVTEPSTITDTNTVRPSNARERTSDIHQRLTDIKKLLRSACANLPASNPDLRSVAAGHPSR